MKSREYSTKELIARFLPYFSKYKHILLFDLTCAAFTTLCDLALPLILRFITQTGMKDLSLLSIQLILQLGALYIVLRLVDTSANYFMANVGHVMGAKIETDMRRDVFNHLQGLSYSFYNENKSGQILTRVTTDLFDVTEFAHHCPEEFFIAGIKILISFIILININVPLTLLLFAMIPLMILSVYKFNQKMRNAQKDQRNHIGEINSGIENNILGAKVVKSFANEEIEKEKFEVQNQQFLGIKKVFYKYMASFHAVSRLYDGLMYVTVIILGGIFMLQGKLSPADLFLYALYISTLLATVKRIVEFMEQFQKGMTGIERFLELMDTETDVEDSENAKSVNNVKGDISFEEVGFRYQSTGESVLEHLNFSIEAGKNIAIVGPSGVGKTTICNLIPRFYDVTEGAIYLDGTNIKELKVQDLRQNIGIVQQDVYLFSGTVFENIEYGKPGASLKEIERAAKLAGAYEFIDALPEKFNTYIGERGTKLSGGQKQRISIARVFLKNPPILILDEATSALDNQSEKIVQTSLELLSKGRTTITIAHRLSTIMNADEILVLTEQGIVEKGKHQELLDRHGFYHELYYGNQWSQK
ncbi:putative lipid A export ATP-binding/permease protein MsbA [Fusobacterium gonidiaformans 3-1-5R]|uniref:Putative lipid A export ATP-binding/permease protein MsbA n=1 Tax=Fusobacterium gonidiaformans 3-1-5R TaxID=469605 RepID=E5BG07_9FUSO|nr:ABC transporter ATP-binding protein [Fusobacterium gonidiaformans]EFS21038.1 putative lipid A export ATP-binding/permease protein MsbA [Fusobacterium gonidiaformans 3-1-5R]